MAEKQGDILKEEPELWVRLLKLSDNDKASVLHMVWGYCKKNTQFLEGIKSALIETERINKIEQAEKGSSITVDKVQLPSKDELALWLVGHLEYTSSELAKKLLGKLKGE